MSDPWLVGCTAILRRRVLPSPIYFEIFEETRIYFKLKLLMIVDRTKSLRVLGKKDILEQNLCQCEKFLFVMILTTNRHAFKTGMNFVGT